MNIMFVCTGNICRSAMAEGILKKVLKEYNIDANVYSCGIYAETGDWATYNAIETVKEYDVDLTNHRATNIRESKINDMDIILCATENHKKSVVFLYPKLKDKVFTMKEYAGIDKDGQDMDIKDPWGYDMNVYINCGNEICKCIDKIVEKLK